MNNEEMIKMFYRRFSAIMLVLQLNKPDLHAELIQKAAFWAPEIAPQLLSNWINSKFPINSKDPLTLTIYSLLTERSMASIAEQMAEDEDKKLGKSL